MEEAKDFAKIYGLTSAPVSAQVIGDTNAKVNYNQDQNGNLTLSFSNAQFDKDVTVVQLNFSEPVKVTGKINDPAPALQSVLENSDGKKAAYEIANQLHKGTNLLDNAGITQDGMDMKIKKTSKTNPEVLNWISKNAEALYETGAGLPDGHYSGMSALSKDKQTLYLFVEGTPTGYIALKGLKNNISRIKLPEKIIIPHRIYNKLYWSAVPGIVYVDVPKERLDKTLQ